MPRARVVIALGLALSSACGSGYSSNAIGSDGCAQDEDESACAAATRCAWAVERIYTDELTCGKEP